MTADIAIESMRRTVPAHRTKHPFYFDYAGVERMICKTAYKYSQSFGIDFDEMQAHANYLYVHALSRFDPAKHTKFSTFLYTVLQNGLITYGKRLIKDDDPAKRFYGNLDEDGEAQDPLSGIIDERVDGQFALSDLYCSLSHDERELIQLVLDGFADSIFVLKKLATGRLGFSNDRFEEAVYGIRELLGEIQ